MGKTLGNSQENEDFHEQCECKRIQLTATEVDLLVVAAHYPDNPKNSREERTRHDQVEHPETLWVYTLIPPSPVGKEDVGEDKDELCNFTSQLR